MRSCPRNAPLYSFTGVRLLDIALLCSLIILAELEGRLCRFLTGRPADASSILGGEL